MRKVKIGKYADADSYFDVGFDLLGDLYKAQQNVCDQLLTGGITLEKPILPPYELDFSRSYHEIDLERIQHYAVNEAYDINQKMTAVDCLQLYRKKYQLIENPNASPIIYLPDKFIDVGKMKGNFYKDDYSRVGIEFDVVYREEENYS